MRFIQNRVVEVEQKPGVDGIYDMIYDSARVCYQSDKTRDAKEFVTRTLLANGHTRPLEFGTVYLVAKYSIADEMDGGDDTPFAVAQKYARNKFSKVRFVMSGRETIAYITTNMRVIMQGSCETDIEAFSCGYSRNWLSDIDRFYSDLLPQHYCRRTFSMDVSRGVSDDFRTHVALSSICESTRFCNYSKDKYGCGLTFVAPYWIPWEVVQDYMKCRDEGTLDVQARSNEDVSAMSDGFRFLNYMGAEEGAYLYAASEGLCAQQLKRLFPLSAKAELWLCGFEDAWDNFFWRRCGGHADPEGAHVANIMKKIYDHEDDEQEEQQKNQ